MDSNKEGLKTAMLIIENRRAEIKIDMAILDDAKKLLGVDAVRVKKESLVDSLCELTLIKGQLVDLL